MNAAVVELFDGVDDLLRRVADTDCPETRKVRARVHAALVAARNALVKTGTVSSQLPVEPSASSDDDDMMLQGDLMLEGDLPTQTLGVALLLGFGIGFMTD